ncbi:MAG: VTT domain-containing protein [Anaerolineae bacterium]|nr:VTT domain-containing protein [Anaerolineae bacterium]
MSQDIAQPQIEGATGAPQAPPGRPGSASRSWVKWTRLVLTLVLAAGISVAVFALSDRVEHFGRYGYPGIFVLSLLSSATIVIPAPSLAMVPVMGAVLNPYLVGLCAGAGDTLGELTGYLAGYSGRAVVEDSARYDKIHRWTQRYGLWVILVLSVIPNPLFDLAGIAAGALKIPLGRFMLVCWCGKTIKTVLFALGGQSIARLLPFLSR